MTTAFEINVQVLEEQVRSVLQNQLDIPINQILDQAHPADIADVLERLPTTQKRELFLYLETDRGAKVLHELGREATRQLFREMSDMDIAHYLNAMPMDEVADILSHVVPHRREALLAAMHPTDSREVRDLIGYPLDSAGRLMTEKFVRLSPQTRVEEVLDYLQQVAPEVETLTDLYILDEDDALLGTISLREIITARDRQAPLQDIMITDLVTVTPETDQEDAARLAARYDFLAVPVVSEAGRLLGIITVDDIIDVLTREDTEDLMRYGAIEDSGMMDQPYFTVPIWRFVRARIGWLLILFLGQTLTGSVLRTFESELETAITLSFFIPLLIGTGGNTGAQIVSTVIRGVALRNIYLRDILKVMTRELISGLLLGGILGVAGILYALMWGQVDFRFALVVGLTVVAICTWSNTVGAVIPFLAHRLNIDPAVVSAPLITTLVDASGLLIYMLIAKALLDVI
jgi:magnesium transporter